MIQSENTGVIQQKQDEYCVLRLQLIGGDITDTRLAAVSRISREYGRGEVHLSTRQGIEIPWIHYTRTDAARVALESAGFKMAASGSTVRTVVACPGSAICRRGIIDTKAMAKKIDGEFFGSEMPNKFKFSVTGCPNNCAKATENDMGIMGGIIPGWDGGVCIDCGLCLSACPVGAIAKTGAGYSVHEEKCLNCGDCTSVCPPLAWKPLKTGWVVYAGGTMGKKPRMATPLSPIITDEEEVYRLVRRAVAWYRANGRARERFGHTLDRIGVGVARQSIDEAGTCGNAEDKKRDLAAPT